MDLAGLGIDNTVTFFVEYMIFEEGVPVQVVGLDQDDFQSQNVLFYLFVGLVIKKNLLEELEVSDEVMCDWNWGSQYASERKEVPNLHEGESIGESTDYMNLKFGMGMNNEIPVTMEDIVSGSFGDLNIGSYISGSFVPIYKIRIKLHEY